MDNGSLLASVSKKNILYSPAAHLVIILLAGLIAYSNSFHGPFQWDGTAAISENPIIKQVGNFLTSTKGYESNPRRFIGYLTFALNYHFGGLNVTGYHLVNLLIHLANALLVYLLVAATFKTPAMRHARESFPPPALIAFFSALLFVSHPLQTQAVTYLAQRFTSLAALFYLLSLALFSKGRLATEEPPGSDAGRPGRVLLYFCGSFVSAVLAMKTKEIAFTLPAIIVLYEFVFFKTPLRKRLLFLLPFALTVLIVPASIMHSEKTLGTLLTDVSAETRLQTDLPRWDYLLTEMRVIVTYLRLLVFPVNQNIDYDYPIYHSPLSAPVLFSLAVLATLFGLAICSLYWSRDKNIGRAQSAPYYRLAGFGTLWFFITLSVESSVIPIVDVIFEHRVYLPSVGFFTGASTVLLLAARHPRVRTAVIALLCAATLLLAGATYARNNVWGSVIALWSDTVKKSPNKNRPRYNLGEAYESEGRLPEALQEFQIAAALTPGDSRAHYNLGTAYLKQQRYDDAVREFRTALAIGPDYAVYHCNLGSAYAKQGKLQDAQQEFKAAIVLKPEDAESHYNLGRTYAAESRNKDAIAELQTAVRLMPDYADAFLNLGLAYMKEKRLPDAEEAFQAVIRIRPDDADAHYSLGNDYYMQGRLDKAAGEYETAIKSRPDFTDAHNNLGAAYYKLGRMDEAQREADILEQLRGRDAQARAAGDHAADMKRQ